MEWEDVEREIVRMVKENVDKNEAFLMSSKNKFENKKS